MSEQTRYLNRWSAKGQILASSGVTEEFPPGTGIIQYETLVVGPSATDGYVLTADSTQPSGVKWAPASGGSSTSPGGSSGQLQFNNAGVFAGASGVTYQSGGSPNLTVQAQADADVALALQAHSGTQSADLQDWKDSSGNVLASIGPLGQLSVVNGSTSGTTEPWLQVTAQANATGTVAVFQRQSDNSFSFVMRDGASYLVASNKVGICYGGDYNKQLFTATAGGIIQIGGEPGDIANETELVNISTYNAYDPGGGVGLAITRWSSTVQGRNAARFAVQNVNSTDAVRTFRLLIQACDYAGNQEGMRIDALGGSAGIGFYGASAVAKQTITGSKGGNTALANLLTALANLGLIVDATT